MGTLRCEGVSVHVDDLRLLRNIDLTVPDGSCCVVMGPSGAGKTTLVHTIAGLMPHTGAITIDGHALGSRPLHRRGVGLLFQQPRLFPTMSALDNVAYPLKLRRTPRAERRTMAAELLAEVGLEGRGRARAHELSGGEQQRVALARALCSDPDVLLLDEPFTGLDLPQRRDLVTLLARLRADRPLTWVIVTHDPDDAAALGDTIAVLADGGLVQHGTVAEVRSRPASVSVAALSGNRNVLRGQVVGGVLQIGRVRLRWDDDDGPVTLGLAGDRVALAARADTAVALPMVVEAIEHRGPHRVAVVAGAAGVLDVPLAGPAVAPVAGSAVAVWFDPGDLWVLEGPTLHRSDRAAGMGGERV